LKEKVAFDPDKHTWRPSPLIGQIVLVTTLNADGASNIAPKSRWMRSPSARMIRMPICGCLLFWKIARMV
jgi:hypothetical protein